MRSLINRLMPAKRHGPFPSAATLKTNSPEVVFTAIHERNSWRDKSSRSGPGSRLDQTEIIRERLPALLAELNCTSMLDAPCGDFRWMSKVELHVEQYYGVDVVSELVEANRTEFGSASRSFLKRDILNDALPKADLVLCRDCLVHFPNADVLRALRNFRRSGATYLLTTTFSTRQRNDEIALGLWRPLNLLAPPFLLPQPLRLINERCTHDRNRYPDKSLGLWRLSDIC